MPKVSIIVPVYNSDQFLSQCLDSILNQSLCDLEVVLVDDGSIDGSSKICDLYASQDKRIVCIHQQNVGAAAARNHGLKVATGDYITFVDSDDWIDTDMYETMITAAEENKSDLVICDCLKEFENGSYLYSHELAGGYYSRNAMIEQYFPQLLMTESMEYPVTISNSLLLIRREVIFNNHLSFPEGIRFSEDLLFGSEIGYYSKSITYLKGYTPYHYRQNETSVTHTEYKDKWPLLFELYLRIKKSFEEKSDFDFKPQIHRCMLFFVYIAMHQRMSAELSLKDFYQESHKVLDNPVVKEALSDIKINKLNISWKQKIISYIYQKKGLRPALLLMRKYINR